MQTEKKKGCWMHAKYDGSCGECREPIYEGEWIAYLYATRTALCEECGAAFLGTNEQTLTKK